MIMGKIVFNKVYFYYEYVVVVLFFVGVSMFFLLVDLSGKRIIVVTIFFGVVIFLGYMVFDSFIFNW